MQAPNSAAIQFLHGTSSASAEKIQREGFRAPAYFTPSLQCAQYYAATGGEASLQEREELCEQKTGINPREHYYPDLWDMCQALYPDGQHPVVIQVVLPHAP